MSAKCVLALFFVLLVVYSAFTSIKVGRAQELAELYVDPAETTGLQIGDTFTIDIKVANITNCAGWQFQLFYKKQVITAIAVGQGPFLSSVANTIFIDGPPPAAGINNDYNSTHGSVFLACATLPATGANGSGTLANVTYQAVGMGMTALAFNRDPTVSKFLDNTLHSPQPIPHTTTDGLVSLITNDIAITDVHLLKTVVNDTKVGINVTAANLGKNAASFSVTLYYNTTEISTQTVTDLPALAGMVLNFTWDTTGVPKGNYTISAYAPPIMGEDDTENNRLTGGWIMQTLLGDINGDHKVNIVDITMAAIAYQATPGDPRWLPNADLDNNGRISIQDIAIIAKEYGRTDL